MNREAKAASVASVAEKLQRAKGIYFTDYLGLKVADLAELRKSFRDKGVEYRVLKNTLVQRAARQVGIDGLEAILAGPTAIAFGYVDPTLPAKVIQDFTKARELPRLKGFIFDGRLMDRAAFKSVVHLPSRDQLLSNLVSGLVFPMSRLAATLGSPMTQLTRLFAQVRDKKQE